MYVFDPLMRPTFHGWTAKIVNHYGSNSIDAAGMLPKDVIDLDIISAPEQSQFCNQLIDTLRGSPHLVNIDADLSVHIRSSLYSQQTMTVVAHPVTVETRVSQCVAAHRIVNANTVTYRTALILQRIQ